MALVQCGPGGRPPESRVKGRDEKVCALDAEMQ